MQRATRKSFPVALYSIIAFTLTILCALSGSAQTFRGGINGTVTDRTGAAIANASVVAVQTDTGVTHTTVSSSGGEFLFQDLPLGTYSVTASFSGFQTVKTDKIMVSAGIIYTLPIVLQLSTSTTTIEVNAASIALDTTTTTQTTVIDARAVANLPLNGRDFTQMVQLTPGFAGYVGGGYGSLNGTRANQMNWQIDGVDNNDLWHNIPAVNQGGVSGIAGIILPLDAVDQFSAQTQAGPEGGRNPGGTINVTLRGGTNQIHGSVYYFNRNEFFGAKSPFSDTKQKVRNYNTGFSVGAPILKDKLFAFLTFEHQRFVIGESGTATEPSVGWQNQAMAILAQQNIPVNPVMQDVLNHLWGTDVLAQDTIGVPNNFHSNDPEYGYSWNGLGKVDWRMTDKDNLSVHWFVGQGNQVAPVGSQLLAFYEEAPIHVQNIAIVYDRVISPSMTNQLLAGVNYFNQVFNDNETNFDVQSLGFITGATLSNAPHISITNFDPVGLTPPEGRNDITGHLTDQLSWTKGKHQMRFGGEYRQAQLDAFYQRHVVGSFTFDGSQVVPSSNRPAANPDGLDGYRYALADYLAGRTSDASIIQGDQKRQVFVNTWFLNAGDSWQATQKLNVNYGIRYDYEGPLHNSYQNMSVFRPELTNSNGLAFQGDQISSLYPKYWKSFSPRLGAAYAADQSTVVRAGFGFFFDTPNLNPFLDNRPGNAAPNGVQGNPGGPDPVYTLDVGETTIVPNQLIFPSGTCNTSSTCGVFSVNQKFRPAYNMNYSLNLEHTIASNVIAQIGYVGSQGRRLLSLLDINQAAPGIYANNSERQAARPYYNAYSQYGNINQIESIGTSNYNSLQTQLRLQNLHGLSSSIIYTWSHNLDQVTSYRGALPQDNFNFKGDYSNSDFDTRNTFISQVSYEIPGSSRGPKELTHGWQINSLLAFHGGQPFTVHASGDLSGTNEGNDRAVQVGPVRKAFQGQKPGANWLDSSAFVDPDPGTFGTTRRNGYYGPGYSDVDFSVFKNTKIKERLTIQFRAEMFNLFNRNNFAPPGGGYVSVGGNFSLNDTIGDYNGAPGIGAGEPFNTQFALKILF
jgi:Carboxypeptidase regulatory-like domain/TonB dependent receptor